MIHKRAAQVAAEAVILANSESTHERCVMHTIPGANIKTLCSMRMAITVVTTMYRKKTVTLSRKLTSANRGHNIIIFAPKKKTSVWLMYH